MTKWIHMELLLGAKWNVFHTLNNVLRSKCPWGQENSVKFNSNYWGLILCKGNHPMVFEGSAFIDLLHTDPKTVWVFCSIRAIILQSLKISGKMVLQLDSQMKRAQKNCLPRCIGFKWNTGCVPETVNKSRP